MRTVATINTRQTTGCFIENDERKQTENKLHLQEGRSRRSRAQSLCSWSKLRRCGTAWTGTDPPLTRSDDLEEQERRAGSERLTRRETRKLLNTMSREGVRTSVSQAAAALVIVDQLHTVEASWGVAGPGEALVEVPLAVLTDKPRRAGARVAADAVQTLATVETARLPGALLWGAVIHVFLTLDSCKGR